MFSEYKREVSENCRLSMSSARHNSRPQSVTGRLNVIEAWGLSVFGARTLFRFQPREPRDCSAYAGGVVGDDTIVRLLTYCCEEAAGNVRVPASQREMTPQKRTKPVACCIRCHAANWDLYITNRANCARTVDRKGTRCRGMFVSAIGTDDWRECPACGATGQEFTGRCTQCQGDGWVLARKG
jgi:hypothetical protein